jgi:hypothetical protein
MKSYIVLTTINEPLSLLEYADNLTRYNHQNTGIIIIGDLKTPNKECKKLAHKMNRKGFEASFMDVIQQKKWLANFRNLEQVIPYNSDNRRNIGYLLAIEEGAEIVISIDDDNYPTNEDFYGAHAKVGTRATLKTVSSMNGWFNPCTMLETSHGHTIYPRGFPYSRRRVDQVTSNNSSGRVVINMGLWLGTPDADAATHLIEPVTIKRLKSEQVMLAPGTFCPINTQNTAFHKDILPCYYYVLMGAQIEGLKLDRYGDIWSGYFAKKVIDQVGDRVSVGKPLTDHRRNIHDIFKDLRAELYGMIMTERLIEFLEPLNLTAKNYSDAYLELAEHLSKANLGNEKGINTYIAKLTKAMKIWIETCERISQ